jgi:PAS domain S-box-containing protein
MTESPVELSRTVVGNMTEEMPIRVLHVDDDASFLKTSKAILEMQGLFQVENATSIEEATEKMKKKEYDAIISDYQMPGKNGLEFLRELRQKGNAIPFVIFTGKGREEVTIKALNLGADGYFNKTGQPETVYGELAHGIRLIVERKKAEESLRKSEQKYRTFVESILEGVWQIDEHALTTFVSPQMKRILGYSPKEMIGRGLFEFMDKEDKEEATRLFARRKQGISEIHDFRFKHKSGRDVFTILSAIPVMENGRFSGATAYVTDITERKKAEELVRANDERYRSYTELTGQLGWTTNANGEVEEDIPAWRKFTSQSHEEVKGWGWTKALHPDDLEHTTQAWEKAVATKSTYEVEYRIRRYDGVYRYFLAHRVPVFNEDGSIREWVGTCIDITERKQAEEALRRSEKKARSLLEFQNKVIDTVIVWIDLLDGEGNVTLWNRAAELISGYTREEVIGHKRIWEWCYPDPQYRAEAFARAKRIIDKKLELNFETEVTCKNGATKTISWYTNSITDEKGKPVGSIAIGLDVSQLKKAEGELREAMEKLEVMNEKLRVVGGLTRHDVRNKLTAVTGNAYLARKKLPGNSEVLDYMKQIEASVEQTVRILEFAKAYEMLGVEELVYVDVEKVVNEAVSLFSGLKDIKVINDCHGLTLLADSLLTQLFYNLIDNSLKYGEKISQIKTFYEETSQGQLKLVYEDDGVGIQFDAKPKLFSRGYTTGKGSGYGLYFIKKMMEVYGWTIEEKGKPGEGARFVIEMPKTSESGKTGYSLR